jgi:hypothetical protein
VTGDRKFFSASITVTVLDTRSRTMDGRSAGRQICHRKIKYPVSKLHNSNGIRTRDPNVTTTGRFMFSRWPKPGSVPRVRRSLSPVPRIDYIGLVHGHGLMLSVWVVSAAFVTPASWFPPPSKISPQMSPLPRTIIPWHVTFLRTKVRSVVAPHLPTIRLLTCDNWKTLLQMVCHVASVSVSV